MTIATKKTTATILAASMALPLLCQAAETHPQLHEVVVTATRYEDSTLSLPANISVISAQDIQNSTAKNIPDLLRSKTGVQVIDITGNQRSYRIDLRGFGETAQSNTLVLIDGRRMNQPDLSGTDWSLIPLERVARIEIVHGGRGSVLYGDNAAGGVINIITHAGGRTHGEISLLGGSYNSFKTAVSGGISNEKIAIDLTGSYLNTDGYRQNSASETKDAGLFVEVNPSDNFSVSLSSGFHDDSTRLPGSLKESDLSSGISRTDAKNPNDYADTKDYYLKIKPEYTFGSENLVSLDISCRERQSQSYSSGSWGDYFGDTEIDTISFSPQILLKHNVLSLPSTFTFGIDYQKSVEDILNTSTFFGTTTTNTYELEKENTGYYLHEKLALSTRTALFGGARYDKATFSFSPSTPAKALMDETLYTVGFNHSFSPETRIYSSFSKSYRYPVIDELFNFVTNTIDTGLKAQTSNDFEIGAQHTYHNDLTVKGSVFYVTTDKEIFYDASSFANRNMDGKTKRKGVEVGFTKSFQSLSFDANYTYMDAQIKGGQYAGHDIPSVPSHKASINSTYSFGTGFTVGINGNYVGTRPFESDFSATATEQDDYFVLNAKLLYEQERYNLFVNINNLTSEKYSEFGALDWAGEKGYYPSPEINAFAGLTFKY